MTKIEFFRILEEGLLDFPAQELQDILYDYKEHFANAQSDGKSEEEIIDELGDPYTIVNQYRSGYIQNSPKYTSEEYTNYEEPKFTKEEPIKDSQSNYNNQNSTVNNFLKIGIIIGLVILLAPFGFAGVTSVFALCIGIFSIPFALSISGIVMLLGKFGFNVLGFGIPAFFADFPTSVIILVTIGSIAGTILSIILCVYLIKFVILVIRKILSKLSNKGGN